MFLLSISRVYTGLLLLCLVLITACNEITDGLGTDDKRGGPNANSVIAKLTNSPKANENTGSMTFNVQLNESSKDSIKVDFETSSNSAKAGSDFIDTTGTLTFLPDTTEMNIIISLIDDDETEPDEKFTLQLVSADGAEIENQSSRKMGTILDDDNSSNTANTVALTNQPESLENNGSISFDIQLSEAASDSVKVKFATKENAAKAGDDFIDTTGTVIFDPGDSKSVITVQIIDDDKWEPDEKFTLMLTEAEEATISNKSSTSMGTILNDDSKNRN